MPRMTFELQAEMEDGSTFDVAADQRDVAQWETEPFGGPFLEYPRKVNAFFRFLAWRAGVRRKLTALTWEQFQEQCIEVHDLKPGADAEDPGKPEASDGISS